ncbi:MAG: TonB-dependent copper receptor [Steroidobacteraceae bacterium]
MRVRTQTLLAGSLAAMTMQAGATTPDEPLQPPLPTVVVTSVAPQSPLTFVTDPKLPRQPVPASDGADYLKTIPGFTAIRNGGTNGDPVLRGMFGSRLNLLTNEGLMPGACPARMDNAMSYVSPETYDRLVVTKGPQTVQWGPGASAGTVRFERRPQDSVHEHPGLRMNANAITGSNDRNDQLLGVLAGGDLGYLRLDTSHSKAGDYEDGSGQVVPARWNKWNADAALAWTPAPGALVELFGGGGDGEARYAGRGMDGSQFRRTSLGLRAEWTGLSGALKEIKASVFRNYADHVMDNYTLRDPNPMSAMPMPVAANVDRLTSGGRLVTSWRFASLEVLAGADAQDSRHRERSALGSNAYRQQPWQHDAKFADLGVFAEATWRLHPNDRAVFGLRSDRAEVTDQRETLGSMMPMPNPTAGVRRRENLLNGFARYEHELRNTPFDWFAGLGRAERMPDYWELFSPDAGPAGSMNAFSALVPEKTLQLDVGVQYKTRRYDVWLSAYAGRIDDFILFTYGGGGMMGLRSSVSQVDANVHGAEAGIEIRPLTQLKAGATLAYAWGENRASGAALPQIPPLDARLSLAYEGARWSAGALLRLVAAQDRVALGQGNVVGRDLARSTGFSVLSFNGAYRFSKQISVAAGVDNLLDRTYTEHLNLSGSADFGYPAEAVRINEPGRTVWAKLLWKLPQR